MARVTSFLLLCLYLLSACSRARTGGLIAEVTPPAPALNPLPTVEAAPLAAASTSTVAPPASPMPTASVTPTPTPSPTFTPSPTNTPTPVPFGARFVVGRSAQDREIESYQFGNGPLPVILVGGIHGGYEWNSILLAYGLMDYLTENPQLVPPEMTIHIIPAANPDGQAAVVGHDGRFTQDELAADTVPGRFNGNGVDLNRNWPCAWEPEGIWRNQPVNAGPYPFSEPENVALRDFILAQQPVVVVFYHSAFDALFTAGCPDVHPPSRAMAEVYGRAADYPVFDHFAAYPVTGDAGDWLATQGIPNFTVELSTHFNLDWSRNLAGFQALLAHLTP